MRKSIFRFKQFSIQHDLDVFKVGTDGVLLGAWATANNANKILDIGTGTGLIAIMLAQRNQNATIDAIDISETAFQQTNININNCPWLQRLQVFHSALQDFGQQSAATYDLIVSNPPYFNQGTTKKTKHLQIARHTTTLSHEDLLKHTTYLLKPSGIFSIILPYEEGLALQKLAIDFGLYCVRQTQVYPKVDKSIERLLMEFKKEKITCVTDDLTIQYEQRNDFTPDYIALTKDFYLKM